MSGDPWNAIDGVRRRVAERLEAKERQPVSVDMFPDSFIGYVLDERHADTTDAAVGVFAGVATAIALRLQPAAAVSFRQDRAARRFEFRVALGERALARAYDVRAWLAAEFPLPDVAAHEAHAVLAELAAPPPAREP